MLESWYGVNLVAHIVAGTVGLVSMLVPLACAKGSDLHRRAGWVFVTSMASASVTGLMIAMSWMLVPLEVRPPARVLEPAALERYVSMVRMSGLFFLLIAVFVASAAWQGVVATRQRRGSIRWGNPVDQGFAGLTLGLGAILVVVGTLHGQALSIGFGVLGMVSGVSDLRFYRAPGNEPGMWVIRHLQAMLGGATAACTAFTVQAVGRTLSQAGYEEWILAAWGGPVALGMFASHLWSRRMRQVATRRYTRA